MLGFICENRDYGRIQPLVFQDFHIKMDDLLMSLDLISLFL